MRRFGPLAFLLFAPGCAGLASAPAAPVSPEAAATRRAAVDAAWSLRYYLGRYALAPDLAGTLDPNAAPAPSGNPTLRELVNGVAEGYSRGLEPEDRSALAEAARRTVRYFGSADEKLYESDPSPGSGSLREGWPGGLEGVSRSSLPMEDSRGYADSRLGALGALAAEASRGRLRLAFSPAPGVPWPPSCELRDPRRLRFPGTTNGFRARFARCADGGFALALDGFSNRSLYLHEAALFKILLEGSAPRVYHDERGVADVEDGLLVAAFAETSPLPRRFDALALGYYDELKEEFAPAAEASGERWRGFTTRVGTTTLVALAVEDSWYGESLGASAARLLDEGVSFDALYFAGSAGALRYRPPYSLSHPSCYLTAAGDRVDLPNEFSGETGPVCHLAVESPLVETHALLDAVSGRADTVDVEGFALALAAKGRGIRLGAAYLVTDYPRPAPVLARHRLAETRAAARLQGARAYAKRLRARLERGGRAYRHPIEAALQEPLEPRSASSARAARESLGLLTPAESAFYERVAGAVPPVLFRTWPGRLAFAVQDGIALSPDQVDALKGTRSAERALTPVGEDALYGARDYLFAGAGQNDSAALYGPVLAVLSGAAWENSFATRASGAALLTREGLDPRSAVPEERLGRLRAAFAKDAAVPADYGARLAALALADYRKLGPEREGARLREILALDDAALWRAIDEDTDAYLEVKILRSFPLDAIACVEMSAEDRSEFDARAGRAAAFPIRGPGECRR